jgi:RNA polymerase-interacting CarD/CdnL/TRCF family regulator
MNKPNGKYKIGDRLVECGQLFRVFKIQDMKSRSGEKQRILFYKPLQHIDNNSEIVCSIPIENIEQTSIRRPMSKDEFKNLLKKIKSLSVDAFPSITEARDALKSNDPIDTLKTIKALKKERKTSENFNKNKKDLLNAAIERVAYEFSEVFGVPFNKAKDKVSIVS